MRILLIEDEPRLLLSLARALREAGYAVDEAPDGVEGHFKALNYEYDAIVLDVMLPGMDGWRILDEVRVTRSTPILMLTAKDALEDRVRGLDAGADDYLIKPFELEELFARLRVIIRRHAGRTLSVLRLHELEIDSRSRSVRCSGTPVALTPREFSILEYLATHRGKVVSRSELYEHLFDENENTLSNLLDVHIHSLRRKIRQDLIVTRRGEGYCIP